MPRQAKRVVRKKTKEARPPLDTMLRALEAMYPTDYIKPGMVLSYLGGNKVSGSFYASVRRYEKPDQTALSRNSVLYSAYGDTALEAVSNLLKMWRESMKAIRSLIR